jgi:hypothetical protein
LKMDDHKVKAIFIGNNLKISKKWKLQGSWNGTIVLTNKKITKVVCFKCYNHKTMACNIITKLEGSMWIQKTMKGENERLLKNTPLYTNS